MGGVDWHFVLIVLAVCAHSALLLAAPVGAVRRGQWGWGSLRRDHLEP